MKLATLVPLLFVLLLAGCGQPPPMARELSMSMSNSEKWPRILASRFPPGTSEKEVIFALQSQGFKVNREGRKAEYSWSQGACRADIYANWETDPHANIAKIVGTDWLACP